MARTVYLKKKKITESLTEYRIVDKFGKSVVHDCWYFVELARQVAKEKGFDLRGEL